MASMSLTIWSAFRASRETSVVGIIEISATARGSPFSSSWLLTAGNVSGEVLISWYWSVVSTSSAPASIAASITASSLALSFSIAM